MTFLLEKIVPLVEQEATLLKGVRGEVRSVRDELESMRAFLRVADARSDRDDDLKAWVKQVRDVAFETEDVLDEFLLRLAQHRGHGFFAFLRKTARNIKTLPWRHQIATDIQGIKTRVKEISERRQRYSHYSQEQGSSSAAISYTWYDSRGNALLLDEADLVGIEKPKDELIGLLVKEESRLGVVAVVGMGGSGKITLVKKVFDDPIVKGYFKCQALIVVSQTFKIEELLRDMIHQLFKANMEPVPQGLDTKNETALKSILKDSLQSKRFFVFLDDIWSINAWESFNCVLPDNGFGSRIIVTTRSIDIASSCKNYYGHVYHINHLQPKEAWVLFCRKAFKLNPENRCPPHLENLSQNFLRRCKGLPLAIVAIGGLLSRKAQTQMEWNIIHRSLGVDLDEDEELNNVKNILLLSYNDLPYYLKSCFLYLSIYPEDYSIQRMKLIRYWIAEGFVEKKESMTLTKEEIAERYFNELINRNLIQIAGLDDGGRVKTCKIHDLMRDVLVIKSGEENFACLVSEQITNQNGRARRLSICNSGENVLKDTFFSSVRSLFIFGIDDFSNSSVSHTCFSGFRLLKVLDLEGAPIDKFPSGIANLLHLKYLSLRKTNVKELPKSLGRLKNLETLDLKQTYVSELPKEIIKLQQLRHLLVYRYDVESYVDFDAVKAFRVPEYIGGLIALQKLAFVDASYGTSIFRALGRLTQLRRLGIRRLRGGDGAELCESIAKMGHLLSFDVGSSDENELLDLRSLTSPPPLLQHLYIEGRIEELPNWCRSLYNLARIKLRWSKIKVDPTEALHSLPNLVQLELYGAYDGEQLCFLTGGFQRLKILWLMKLEGLKLVKVEEGTMPHLQELEIRRCETLEKVPVGIEGLINLKSLHFYDMPAEIRRSIKPDEGEDHWRVAHIPYVRFTYWTGKGWKRHRL